MDSARKARGALWLAAVAMPCFAHHGVAPHYDESRTVEIEGTVAKFDFINPHSFVYVQTGDGAVWQCELASRTVLARNGLRQDTFKIGERVRIRGIPGRKNPTGCALRTAYFADGSVLESNTLFGPTQVTPVADAAAALSIVGTWTMKRFSVSMYEGVLTAAGEAARAAFDPVRDDPAIYCDPASPVRFWVNVNEPFAIRREPDRVVIDHTFMDSERVVHLNVDAPPEGVERSTMGFSRGRFEGDALVVVTDHFTAGTLEPRRGVMHTANLRLTERLEVDPDTGELVITWTIDDPEYFKEPLTQTERFVRSVRVAEPYDCRPGYQQ